MVVAVMTVVRVDVGRQRLFHSEEIFPGALVSDWIRRGVGRKGSGEVERGRGPSFGLTPCVFLAIGKNAPNVRVYLGLGCRV